MFRIIKDWEGYREHVLLRDGTSITVRLATQNDVPVVEELIKHVSEESRYFRFMGGVSYVSRSILEDLCANEPRDKASLLAVLGGNPTGKIVGMGNYAGMTVRNAAEVSFLVDDEYHGRGIGTLLLERLAGIAAANGFVGFEAEMLYDNEKMSTVFRDAGFETVKAIGGSTVHIEFPVGGNAAVRERAELRDRIAAANSLISLLKPSCIAVVGASRDPKAAGSLVFRHIVESDFSGTVYPVNNQASSIRGVRAYSSVTNLPERPDLVIIAVPAPNVLDVVTDSASRGARGIIVISAGFAETGEDGLALQNKLVEIVRSNGMRLIGPNCLGIINTQNEIRLNASLAELMPPSGKVGFYSHTGALGVVILDYAAERGIGFSTFVSGGNRGDVSGNDLLEYWEEDPETDVVVLYLERFGNPRRFARVARRVSQKKPVLCVKSGRSKAGQERGEVHVNGSEGDTEVDALFQQTGVIRAETLEEMFDVAMLLAHQPMPNGNRVAVLSNAAGGLTICADACDANGLSVTADKMLNLGALATAVDYERAVTELLKRDDVDSLIAIFACIGGCDPDPVGRAIRRGALFSEKDARTRKPVLLCLMGTAKAIQVASSAAFQNERSRSSTNERQQGRTVFPSYRFPESAALALARVTEYAANRKQPRGRLLWFDDVDLVRARRKLDEIMERTRNEDEPVSLSGKIAEEVLVCFGLKVDNPAGKENAKDQCRIQIKSDPHFGPLIAIALPGKPTIQRITPLTDRDAKSMLTSVGWNESSKCEEFLGRISQLVEELPWLVGMESVVRMNEAEVPVLSNVELAFRFGKR